MTLASAIYEGEVVHERLKPRHHRMRYSVFSLLLDLDELETLSQHSRLFGYNRWRPFTFLDRDHGPSTGEPLRPWVERRMAEGGIEPDGGPIRILCYPRMFGYVFNPLSVYFCYGHDGDLKAILYEVCNTFTERHTYVIPAGGNHDRVIRQTCMKSLYVSPFIPMETRYRFRIVPPGENVNIVIRQEDDEGLLLAASFRGSHRELSDRALMRCMFRFPLMTVKIIAGIHWEALKLWRKGLRIFPHSPAEKRIESSAGTFDNSAN